MVPEVIGRGLLVAGDVIPGTEWIRRDPLAWWAVGERGTRKRAKIRDLFGGHWTAGEAGTGDPDGTDGPLDQYDDDGPRVVRAMKARKRPDGSLMEVAIDFVIGACAPDDDFANVWQTCDIGLTAAIHMGKGEINARCIGVEVVSAGLPGKFDTRRRPHTTLRVHGRLIEQLLFYPGQLRSYVRLAEAIVLLGGRSGISLPRRVPMAVGSALSLVQLRKYAGAIEHLHCPPHEKIDGGTQLVQGLIDLGGWTRG